MQGGVRKGQRAAGRPFHTCPDTGYLPVETRQQRGNPTPDPAADREVAMTALTAGAQLRADIQAELGENGVDLDPKEAALFEQAIQTADLLEALEGSIVESGPTVPDPKTGAPTIAPAVVEARLQRQVLQRLLGGLDLEGKGSTGSAASQHGRMAAQKRWSQHNARRGRT